MSAKVTEFDSRVGEELVEEADATIAAYFVTDSAEAILCEALDKVGNLLNELGTGFCMRKGFRMGWVFDEDGDAEMQIEMMDDTIDLDAL